MLASETDGTRRRQRLRPLACGACRGSSPVRRPRAGHSREEAVASQGAGWAQQQRDVARFVPRLPMTARGSRSHRGKEERERRPRSRLWVRRGHDNPPPAPVTLSLPRPVHSMSLPGLALLPSPWRTLGIHALKNKQKQGNAKIKQHTKQKQNERKQTNKTRFFSITNQNVLTPRESAFCRCGNLTLEPGKRLSVWQTVPLFILATTDLAKLDTVIFLTTAHVSLDWQGRAVHL